MTVSVRTVLSKMVIDQEMHMIKKPFSSNQPQLEDGLPAPRRRSGFWAWLLGLEQTRKQSYLEPWTTEEKRSDYARPEDML